MKKQAFIAVAMIVLILGFVMIRSTTRSTIRQSIRSSTGNGNAASSGTPKDKYLIVSFGESNSGGFALNTDAATWEVASRDDIQMWNVSTAAFQNLDIGTNNNLDHSGLGSTTHGWELGLANRVRQGYFDRPVYYLQTGQGASTVASWAVGGTFWTKFLARTAAVKSAISDYETAVWVTLGINDAIAGTATATFKAGFEDIISRIKAELPGAKIYITNLPAVNATYNANSAAIAEIVDADPTNLRLIDVLTPSAMPYRDTNHWSYAGMKRLAARFVDAMDGDFPLTSKALTFSDRDDAGFVFTTAVNQHSHVPTVWTKSTFPRVVVNHSPESGGYVFAIDGDVSATNWSPPSVDSYFGGTYNVTTTLYTTILNGNIDATFNSNAPCWVRYSASSDDLVLERSTDGGVSWSTLKTFIGAFASATDVRIKTLSAVGASQFDVWLED